MSLDHALVRGLAALELALSDKQRDQLLAYLRLLDKWNRVYNLTAVRDIDAMLTQHVLDSLAVIPHVKGRTLLDVGSGGGLPGIPLAIASPEMSVTLLDSNHKKATFLKQAVIELQLSRVAVVCERAESWQ
ncbi:MAG TPA: 16S rRNA (guanine(527)-N(7))-methyltransferase RsmG, partial [Burkholderiales bacterium]